MDAACLDIHLCAWKSAVMLQKKNWLLKISWDGESSAQISASRFVKVRLFPFHECQEKRSGGDGVAAVTLKTD